MNIFSRGILGTFFLAIYICNWTIWQNFISIWLCSGCKCQTTRLLLIQHSFLDFYYTICLSTLKLITRVCPYSRYVIYKLLGYINVFFAFVRLTQYWFCIMIRDIVAWEYRSWKYFSFCIILWDSNLRIRVGQNFIVRNIWSKSHLKCFYSLRIT